MTSNSPVHFVTPTPLGIVRIATATPNDQAWIEHLQRRFSNNLGFVPRAGIAGLLQRRNYLRIDLDNADAGFLLICGGKTKPVRISQIAVDEQLWRNGIGSIAIELIRKKALLMPKTEVVLTCREGLAMNDVALDTGATHVSSSLNIARRKKRLRTYRWTPYSA